MCTASSSACMGLTLTSWRQNLKRSSLSQNASMLKVQWNCVSPSNVQDIMLTTFVEDARTHQQPGRRQLPATTLLRRSLHKIERHGYSNRTYCWRSKLLHASKQSGWSSRLQSAWVQLNHRRHVSVSQQSACQTTVPGSIGGQLATSQRRIYVRT